MGELGKPKRRCRRKEKWLIFLHISDTFSFKVGFYITIYLFKQVPSSMRILIEPRTPPTRAAPRRERRAREREQLRQMKRTAVGSDIQSNKRRKDFGKPGF